MTQDDLLKKLSEGYSIQSETANKFWLALIVSCIITITGRPDIKSSLIDLPFTLGKVNSADFYTIMIILVCTIIIAYASAMIQAIRARKLIQKILDNVDEKDKFTNNVHIQDLVDCTLKPTFNRVAPIAQYLFGDNQFFGDEKPSKIIKLISTFFYSILKITTLIFIYFIPIVAVYKSWKALFNDNICSTIGIPTFMIATLICLSVIVTLILLYGDIKYFIRVIRRIHK